jgi:hypothetical protein
MNRVFRNAARREGSNILPKYKTKLYQGLIEYLESAGRTSVFEAVRLPQRLTCEGVTAAIHHSKIVTAGIVADRVGLHLEYVGADLLISLRIVESEVARTVVCVVQAAEIVGEGNRVAGQRKQVIGPVAQVVEHCPFKAIL